MYLLSRNKLLGGLAGLLVATAVLAPVAAGARPAATVDVAVPGQPVIASPDLFDVLRCDIPVHVTWDSTAIPGPSVTIQLEVSADGGTTWSPAGTLVRAEDTGKVDFNKRPVPGTYMYQVSLSKGPTHVVASGTSNSVTCSQ